MSGSGSPGLLSQRIFWRSIGAMAAVAALALLVHAALLLAGQRREDLRALERTVDVLLPNFASAAWQINEGTAQTLLQSLVAIRGVQSARYDDQQLRLEARALHARSGCPVRIERNLAGLPVGTQQLSEGRLSLCYAPAPWADVLRPLTWQTLIPLLLLVIASVYPARMIRRSVLQPIESLTRRIRDEASVLDIDLHRPASDRGDELDRLVDELKRRTQRFLLERGMAELAFQALQDGMVITDRRHHVLRVNPAVQRLLSAVDIHNGVPLDTQLPVISQVAPEQPREMETADGKTLEVSVSHIDNPGGELLLAYLFRDLTLRRQYEATVQQSHKMNALGTLSGGVAHDFNNLLMTISGNAELIGLADNLGDDERQMLQAIRHAARRGATLTAQLLTFARKQPLHPVVLSVADVCSEVHSLSRRTLGSTHRLTVSVADGLSVRADATFLETALLNLLVNARDAQPDGGAIHLLAEGEQGDAGSLVRFSVVNGGPAIPKDVVSRMGEPFFTTKAKGKGTGLGLSMVMGFAEQSGGRVEIESVVGRTRVSILLPSEATGLASDRPGHAPSEDAAPGAALSVLVVDDDVAVLQAIVGMMRRLGHDVTAATGPEEVDAMIAQGGRWDLILCDMVLQDSSGLDVFDRVRRQGIDTPVAFISGNVPPALEERLALRPPFAVLHKPVDLDALRQLMTQVGKVAPGSGP